MGLIPKTLGIIVPIVLLFVLSGSFIKGLKRAKETQKLIQKTQSRLQKAKEENQNLQSQLEFTQSQQFIEEQLRNKLGLAKEGEIILVLPDNETLAKLAPTIPEEQEQKPQPNWKKWAQLFL